MRWASVVASILVVATVSALVAAAGAVYLRTMSVSVASPDLMLYQIGFVGFVVGLSGCIALLLYLAISRRLPSWNKIKNFVRNTPRLVAGLPGKIFQVLGRNFFLQSGFAVASVYLVWHLSTWYNERQISLIFVGVVLVSNAIYRGGRHFFKKVVSTDGAASVVVMTKWVTLVLLGYLTLRLLYGMLLRSGYGVEQSALLLGGAGTVTLFAVLYMKLRIILLELRRVQAGASGVKPNKDSADF